MKTKRISDNHSFSKSVKQLKGLRMVGKFLPFAKPILIPLGVNYTGLKESFHKLDKIHADMMKLSTLPDRFNDIFADLGWIMYEMMNVEVAERAIELSNTEGLREAEEYLADYYSPSQIDWQLKTMYCVNAFRERIALAEMAMIDYGEGRYHASVPVVLALLDGMVNDVAKSHRGFFAEGTDFTAWDSIAAHDSGLNKLAGLLRKRRIKTITDQITIPYRNGIVHGMDLGYANRVVAAKCWGALFATREWAIKFQNNQISQPPEDPEISWADIFEKMKETESLKRALETWQPRDCIDCSQFPVNPDISIFLPNTPERLLVMYLYYWSKKNFGHMSKMIHAWGSKESITTPVQVRQEFYNKLLSEYKIVSITDEAPGITVIKTELRYDVFGHTVDKMFDFRLVCVDKKGAPTARTIQSASWSIISWCIY